MTLPVLNRELSWNRCKFVNLSTYNITLIKQLFCTFVYSLPSLLKNGGVPVLCPTNCLSKFSLMSILSEVSTTCLRFSIGNNTNTNVRAESLKNFQKFVVHHNYAWQPPPLPSAHRHQLSLHFH